MKLQRDSVAGVAITLFTLAVVLSLTNFLNDHQATQIIAPTIYPPIFEQDKTPTGTIINGFKISGDPQYLKWCMDNYHIWVIPKDEKLKPFCSPDASGNQVITPDDLKVNPQDWSQT